MVVIRYISLVLVWILTAVVVVGSVGESLVFDRSKWLAAGHKEPVVFVSGGTGILWWLYVDHSKSVNAALPALEQEVAKDNQKALLIYAIAATVFTVRLLLLYINELTVQVCSTECRCTAGGSAAPDVLHEEASGAHHRSVSRGW